MIGLLPAAGPLPADSVPIDARTRAEYEAGHLPGAIHLAWEEFCVRAPTHAGEILGRPGYWGVLDAGDPAALGRKLGERGIPHDRPLVIYAGGAASRGRDGRVAWMLLYAGASRVFLLDGGIGGWIEAGGNVTAEIERRDPIHFELQLRLERRIDLEELRRLTAERAPHRLVDTRSPAEYSGERDAYLPRRGHLPGAISFPFTDLFGADNHYLAEASYLARLPDALRSSERIVAYCEVGVRAGTFALLHEVYTGRVVSVFDGSLMEWALDPELPLDSGAGKSSSPQG